MRKIKFTWFYFTSKRWSMCYSNSSQKLVQDSNCRIFRQAERSSLQAWSIAGVLLVFGWNDSQTASFFPKPVSRLSQWVLKPYLTTKTTTTWSDPTLYNTYWAYKCYQVSPYPWTYLANSLSVRDSIFRLSNYNWKISLFITFGNTFVYVQYTNFFEPR